MNFVKGVTGFLRRGSASQEARGSGSLAGPDSSAGTAPVWRDIQFSDNGAEASLDRLWGKFQDASTKRERQTALEEFLLEFNRVFERWVPLEEHRLTPPSGEEEQSVSVTGCMFGHPTRIILGLIHELKHASDFIADLHASSDVGEPYLNTSETELAISLLSTLSIVTRSPHNRTVFSYFGGLHTLTGVLKNAVVHIKGFSGAASPNTVVLSFLQCLLAHVVSITASFIEVEKGLDKQPRKLSDNNAPLEVPARGRHSMGERRSVTSAETIASSNFALLLETGGLNWFVELLRILRKLRLNGVGTDESLEKLTLQTLKAVIAASSRAQNHFRSIGGLEVLLDGLGSFSHSRPLRKLVEDFNMQVLTLEVIREAIFRNVNSLQAVKEMGGLEKFVLLFRWVAFVFPDLLRSSSADASVDMEDLATTATFSKLWPDEADQLKEKDVIFSTIIEGKDPCNAASSRLCEVLCSFLVATGDIFSLSGPTSQETSGGTSMYWESATRFIVNVLLGAFRGPDNKNGLEPCRLLSSSLQRNVLSIFKKMLAVSPPVLQLFRDEGVWTVLFSKYFFYYGLEGRESPESQPLQLEVVSFVELAAAMNGSSNNLAECNALVQALEQCIHMPSMATMILKSLHRILQLVPELTSSSFRQLEVVVVLSEVMAAQLQALRNGEGSDNDLVQCRDAAFLLFNECLSLSEDAKSVALRSMKLMDVLFGMISDSRSRNFAIDHITSFMKLPPSSEEDQDAKMELCMKFLETLSRVQSERHSTATQLVLDLLTILRDVLRSDLSYYQALFREVECFVHVVSLLNEDYPENQGRQLSLEVISTLIYLLKGNEASKLAFRSLVGPGYKMLETLLLDRYPQPTQKLVNALLDMLVDGNFDIPSSMIIQNEDVVILVFNIIRLCEGDTQLKSLDIFLKMLEESTANQSSCVRAGLFCNLLDWFSVEEDKVVLQKVAQLMQLVGGHSMSGKEMRRIFFLLRNTMNTSKAKNTLLLSTFKSMLREEGPSVFFELSGRDSGIAITTPLRWPTNKGFSFLCWIRLESFCSKDMMGLCSFLSESDKGCTVLLSMNKIIIEVESTNHKRQAITIDLNLVSKKWHFISITHSTGRALSGSLCKVYVDGVLIGTEKLRYPKVYDAMTRCTIGASAPYSTGKSDDEQRSSRFSSPLRGQLGPVYFFEDVLTSGQVQGVFALGAGYIHSFLPSEVGCIPTNTPDDSVFNSKEGLSSKMMFGYNALASTGRALLDVVPIAEHLPENVRHEATIMTGTQLCYRCLVQNNIHCVGGITVFFPLLTRLQQPLEQASRTSSNEEPSGKIISDVDDYYLVDVIELLSAVANRNYANQKFLHSSGGLSLLGFLLQFVAIKQLSVKLISALNTLLCILADSSDSALSDVLVREAIHKIYLNPSAWVYSPYVIQRELYLSLINFLETRNYDNICSLSRFLDIIHQFYSDKPRFRRSSKSTFGTGERPRQEELSQLRILVLALAEGAIRHRISTSDARCLISFVDRSDDLTCVEEVLQMLLGLLGGPDFLSSFLESVHGLGGLHVILNLLKRQQDVIRILALNILGLLFLSSPAERKATRLFGIGSTAPKGPGDVSQNKQRDAGLWFSITERLLQFPFTDALRITLFDILLGASISKQILQGGILAQFGKPVNKRSWLMHLSKAGNPAHTSTFPQFFLPRVLGVILRFVEVSEDWPLRQAILKDILSMIEANPANSGLLMQEPGWQDWVLAVFASASARNQQDASNAERWSDEAALLRKILCAVHVHAMLNIKGGWRQVERTVTHIHMYTEQDPCSTQNLTFDFLGDVVDDVLKSRFAQTSLSLQPCRDNVLYLLSLVEELAVADALQFLPFLDSLPTEESEDNSLLSGSYVDLGSETRRSSEDEDISVDEKDRKKSPRISYQNQTSGFNQRLYDNVWVLLCTINGMTQGAGSTSSSGPSFGQRARGLVESLNIPAAEVAAAVSGGLGSVGINVPSKIVEKAMKLRGEKFSRVAYRLVLVYLYRADLEAALCAVQQFVPLLPSFLSGDSEQNKAQLHLLLWCLLDARTHVGAMDEGARYHVLSQLIQEILEAGKNNLASSLVDKEKRTEEFVMKDSSSAYGLLQQDKVLSMVREDKKFLKVSKRQWAAAMNALRVELFENREYEMSEAKTLQEQAQTILSSLYNAELSRRAAYQLKQDADEQAVASRWCLIFRNLTDERGPWSSTSFPSSRLMWWKLDKTEDPLRRRMKLKRNYHFDRKLLQPPASSAESSSTQGAAKLVSSGKVGLRKAVSFLDRDTEADDEMEDANDAFDNENEGEGSTNSSEDDGSETRQNPAEDEVLLSVSCVLVSAKRKYAGRLEVTRSSLHFHVEFVIEGTGGSLIFESSGGFARQDTGEGGISGKHAAQACIKHHRKWDLFQVSAIYATRYLLQHTALEIFFSDAAPPVFLNFQTQQVARDVALKIIATRSGTGRGKSNGKDKGQIHYVDRKKAVELAERARDSWRRREYSNFDYLMILNTLAGRSYNDLTQYPVFPWILADYTSEVLDLSNPSVFRDLSKPVGALDEKRFKVFEERYTNFSDPDIPSFYYGSHYSSMGIVLFYLLRLEPFSSLHRTLQGGKFDHADRLFHSIQNAYANGLTNTSDVKEIIPEFFYMSEFLTNTNGYFIGVKQDGQQLDNVILPPWAKGSPEEFIRLNREALESEHVSENLHHWIDLVFGYKQRGRPAVEAANVFYHLTYEGTMDLESMTDARQRASVEDQIANFGQTPIQLFRKKHPKRGPAVPLLRPLYYSPASITLSSCIGSRYLSSGRSDEDPPVLYISHSDGKIVAVTTEMIASTRMWLTPSLHQAGGSFTFSSPQDFTFGLGSEVWPSRKICGYFAETLAPDSSCFCLLQANSSTYLLTCGHWDNSFKLLSLSDGHITQSNCQHKDVVTCISASADGSVVVTGSRDTTVMVWEVISTKRRSEKIHKHEMILSDKPRHVLCGHDDALTAVVVRTELDLVVSGSKDGTCILYTLRQGRYVRSLVHPSRKIISLLVVSQHGLIVLFSNEDLNLHLCSVNGKWLAEAELNGRLSSMELSSCGEFLLCGGDQGQVTVRKMHSLELVHRYDCTGSPITSLCVTPEDCFLVGTRDGKVLIYAVETGLKKGIAKLR